MDYKAIRILNGEIIVICLIIAIAGIIVYPAFRDDEEYGKRTACSSRLKQLFLATATYAQDYDGKLPPKNKWSDCVKPFLEPVELLKCPTDKNADKSRCSYSFNSKLGLSTFSQLKSQPTTPIYFDSKGGWNSCCPVTGAVARHLGGVVFAFADGHVKWKRLEWFGV